MTTILALFIIMIADPIRICVAVSFAFLAHRSKRLTREQWIALATIATTFVIETTLHLTNEGRTVFPALFVSLAASLCHVLIAMWVFRLVAKRRAKREG